MPRGTFVSSHSGLPDDDSPSNRNNVYSASTGPIGRSGEFARELLREDNIARFILAIGHSGQYAGNHREQLFISQRTVAVMYYQDTIYVATNDLRNDDVEDVGTTLTRVQNALRAEGYANVRFISNPFGDNDRGLHAEMQLLSYFMAKGWQVSGGILGVSKPCCRFCALNLDRYGIWYSYWHDQNVGGNYRRPDAGYYR